MLQDVHPKTAKRVPLPDCLFQMCPLRRLFAMIGKQKFRICAHHVVIGKQVLVRSNCPQISRKVLVSLSQLLPDSAVQMTVDAEKYLDRKTCNLISISTSVPIPKQASELAETLVIDMVECEEDQIKCTLHSKSRTSDKLPQYLVQVERAIRDTNLSDTSLELHMQSLKTKWQEKCMIAYSYCRAQGTQLTDEKLLHGIEASDADLPLLRFWTRTAVPLSHNIQ